MKLFDSMVNDLTFAYLFIIVINRCHERYCTIGLSGVFYCYRTMGGHEWVWCFRLNSEMVLEMELPIFFSPSESTHLLTTCTLVILISH